MENSHSSIETNQSYWKRALSKINHYIGYVKLEDEQSAAAVELSQKPLANNDITDSDETLGVDIEKAALKYEAADKILKTSIQVPWYQKHKGIIYMVLATLSGCFLNMSIKAISRSDERLPILELVVIRGIIGSVISIGMMYFQKVNNWMGPSDAMPLLLLRGLFAFLALTFQFFALFSLSVGDATIISFSAPVITGFLGSIILKEKWETVDQLAGFFSMIGVIFIARPPFLFGTLGHQVGEVDDSIMLPDARAIPAIVFDSENSDASFNGTYMNNNTLPIGYTNQTANHTISTNVSTETLGADLLRVFGIIMGLAAACCAASAFIVIRKLKGRTDPLHVIFYFHWILVPFALFLGPLIPSWMDSATWILPKYATTWALVLTGTTFGTMGQIFLTKALQTETAGKAASINYIQVIFAFALEWLFWNAIPHALSLFGASIIIASLVFATIYKNKFH